MDVMMVDKKDVTMAVAMDTMMVDGMDAKMAD